jgi:SAM-dependent methyltransferase
MNWFENWFDSHYYHKLYFDRDEQEAAQFISNLMQYLQPTPNSFMLDVACGKGRHSITLAAHQHLVTGIDISPSSIVHAKQFENNHLEFFQHDMRLTFRINYYHYAFNLFTSFGYFDTKREDESAIRTIAQSLKPNGVFVFDYLNSNYVTQHLVPHEIKLIEGTTFRINRFIEKGFFVKQIQIEDAALAVPVIHQERVAAFQLKDLETMFAKQQLTITALFGDYQLNPFDATHSKRLIIIAKKG